MNIAIIGTGNVGGALTRTLVRAGHEVILAARDADATEQAATEAGARAAGTARDAAATADVVILAIPFDAVEAVAAEIAPAVSGKVVVDVTNPAKPDWSGPRFEGDSASEHLAAWLREARVVKAFNTIFAGNIEAGAVDGVPLDAFVAGDDEAAKAVVAELARSIGLNPVDAGPLSAARQLEAIAWLNISLNARGGNWRSGWKLLGLAA